MVYWQTTTDYYVLWFSCVRHADKVNWALIKFLSRLFCSTVMLFSTLMLKWCFNVIIYYITCLQQVCMYVSVLIQQVNMDKILLKLFNVVNYYRKPQSNVICDNIFLMDIPPWLHVMCNIIKNQ